MSNDVTIIVATFGDPSWRTIAAERAIPSAGPQAPTIAVHGNSIAEARNTGAVLAQTEWLIFLDADDELAPGYVDAMLAAGGDLRAPELHLIRAIDSIEVPDLASRDMAVMNQCPIGTMIRRQRLFDVGGFWEERAWEDWSLFRRCWLDDDVIVHVPGAVYRSFVGRTGRNSTVTDPKSLHREIIASHDRWLSARRAA